MIYIDEFELFLLMLGSLIVGFLLNFLVRLDEIDYLKGRINKLEKQRDELFIANEKKDEYIRQLEKVLKDVRLH